MNFKNIPNTYHPAYTWLWNSRITQEGIKLQLEEMYASGIRAFYVIGEPENFRPKYRRTHLSPEYLSEEYLELLYYAYETGKELGMDMWLYNEGGFPSGMACGQIRKVHPELAMQEIEAVTFPIPNGSRYTTDSRAISAFAGSDRIYNGYVPYEDTLVTEYRVREENWSGLRTDNASRKNTEVFLELTHEKMKRRFGSAMGTDITLMFDDESFMGTWTDEFDRLFQEKHGYDIRDFIPYIMGDLQPETDAQYRARSDYFMLCGELIRDNYFTPMKQWLRQHNMRSTGHLDNDHRADGNVVNRYGNVLQTLREFDVPGIDVIWEQIGYPRDGKCCPEGMAFFPRMASSAARQLGHSTAVSESLAVYGSHVDPEQMRFVVNYQAVRGISLFNFMVVSYDRETPMSLQYRPNFNKNNPSMDRLTQINEYTARLSYILQNSKADISTALYYPARSICAGGKLGQAAMESFTKLGDFLEEKGVSFDIIDEALVLDAVVENGTLVCEHVAYSNIFLPEGTLEPTEVIQKLSSLPSEINPCILRESAALQARSVLFEDGSTGYFLCNTSNTPICETVGLPSEKEPFRLDLFDGTLYTQEYTKENGIVRIPISLGRGESIFLLLPTVKPEAVTPQKKEFVCTLTDIHSYISRRYQLDFENGIRNTYYTSGPMRSGLYEWDPAFSGEVTYLCKLPLLDAGEYLLDLGEVRNTVCMYLDKEKLGEATLPPYQIRLDNFASGKELRLVVANTTANACARTDYFDRHDIKDVGPYHARMVLCEARQPSGGLLGPLTLYKLI